MKGQNSGIKERLLQFIGQLGISVRAFEAKCGMAYGYIANISKGIGAEKLQRILSTFPELNSGWLMTGEGEMLRASVTQNGNHNNIQLGNGNIYICIDSGFKALMQLVEANQKNCEQFNEIVKKSQEQIDRLIALLEKKYNE